MRSLTLETQGKDNFLSKYNAKRSATVYYRLPLWICVWHEGAPFINDQNVIKILTRPHSERDNTQNTPIRVLYVLVSIVSGFANWKDMYLQYSIKVLCDLLCFQIFYHSFIVSRDVQYPAQWSVSKTLLQLIPAFHVLDVSGERLRSCFSAFISSSYMNTIENNKSDPYHKQWLLSMLSGCAHVWGTHTGICAPHVGVCVRAHAGACGYMRAYVQACEHMCWHVCTYRGDIDKSR